MLSVVLDGYEKLDYILSINERKGPLKQKIETIIGDANYAISKADIEEILFSNQRDSIEEVLGKLIKEGKIKLLQKGKYSLYYKNL